MSGGRVRNDELLEREARRQRKDEDSEDGDRLGGVVRTLVFLLFAGGVAAVYVERNTVLPWAKQVLGLAPALDAGYPAALEEFLTSMRGTSEAGVLSAEVEGETLVVTVNDLGWNAMPEGSQLDAVIRWAGTYHRVRVAHGLPDKEGATSPVEVRDSNGGLRARNGSSGPRLIH